MDVVTHHKIFENRYKLLTRDIFKSKTNDERYVEKY